MVKQNTTQKELVFEERKKNPYIEEIKKDAEEYKEEIGMNKFIRKITISHSANQFMIRLPKEVSELMNLNKNKKYKFKLIIDYKNIKKGEFEIEQT